MPAPINLSRFDLVSLRLYVVTVDAGSLTVGADRFGISLAAASKRIAELESHLGCPLLLRSKKGVTPTAAGQTFLRHAIGLTAGLEQLALAMDDYQRGASGHLRIWANPSAFCDFLPRVLADYTALHPGVMIDLEECFSEEAARAVIRGAAELAVFADNTSTDGLQTVVCEVDELVVVHPVGHPLTREARVPLEELLDHDIVGMSRSTSLMRQLASGAGAGKRPLKVRVQVRNFDAMARMVAAGMGVGIMPRAAALPLAGALGLRVTHIRGMRTERALFLAMRDRTALSAAARAFVDLVEQRMAARDELGQETSPV